MAALMEVKDKLSPQQFDWVNEMLLKGDKKITASVSTFKKSRDAKDFANTIKRFYNKAFGIKWIAEPAVEDPNMVALLEVKDKLSP